MGITRNLKLSPEGTRTTDLQQMSDAAIADGINPLVLMLHSTSLVAGQSPYAKTADMLEGLYRRTERLFEHLTHKHNVRGILLSNVANRLRFPLANES